MGLNTSDIKARVNLLDLTGVNLKRVSGTRGGEYAGPCPKCGGKDRFHVQPETGMFMCRQCHPTWGDAIEFLRWRDGLGFREACAALGGERARTETLGRPRAAGKPSTTAQLAATAPPSATWQGRARDFLAYAQRELWRSQVALEYLHGRGLTDDTIRAAGLGYNPTELRDAPARWGLDGDAVWLPVGWVIPCTGGGHVWYCKVRRPDPATPKYAQVRGGRAALYVAAALGGHGDAILVEGEFDALLLGQHVGKICGVATLGSATRRIGAADVDVLGRVRRLWTVYDADAAGASGAAALSAMSARVSQLPRPANASGKDITDLWRGGHDLARWVVGCIGPADTESRLRWLTRYLDALWGDTDSMALWLALLAEYERLCSSHGVKGCE